MFRKDYSMEDDPEWENAGYVLQLFSPAKGLRS